MQCFEWYQNRYSSTVGETSLINDLKNYPNPPHAGAVQFFSVLYLEANAALLWVPNFTSYNVPKAKDHMVQTNRHLFNTVLAKTV